MRPGDKMADTDRFGWLENFAYVLDARTIQTLRRKPEFDAFTGSKWAPLPALILIATIAGAFGGVAVSPTLWSKWWQVPLWPFAFAVFGVIAGYGMMAIWRKSIGILVGWGIAFGVLIGVFTMWGAQTESSGWAYAITGGLVFFLLGITGSELPPPNTKSKDTWFLTGAIAAPIGSCLAAWLYRNRLPDQETLMSAALTGALAAFIFLGVMLALYLQAWKPARGMLGLANLYLHNGSTAQEGIGILDSAIKADPNSAALRSRRGLAHAIAGNEAAAEADWAKALELDPESAAPHIDRGWDALRRGDNAGATASFEVALKAKKSTTALVGLGLTHLQADQAADAVKALSCIKYHDELSMTYLAEAQLAAGDAAAAEESAAVAIDEFDSMHGRSWLVRADAARALGRIEDAQFDYERALWAADEIGIERRARRGLDEVGWPSGEDDEE